MNIMPTGVDTNQSYQLGRCRSKLVPSPSQV